MFLSLFSTKSWSNDKDPYFFLNPKINNERAIEIPFTNIDKKGGVVSAIFWSTPQPQPKILKILPFGNLTETISLKVDVTSEYDRTTFSDNYFKKNNPDNLPIFLFEIFKINNDLSLKKISSISVTNLQSSYVRKNIDNWEVVYNIESLGYKYEYGQYKVVITSLLDMPYLTDGGNIKFFLHLFSEYHK